MAVFTLLPQEKYGSEWCDFKDKDGNVLAKFLIAGTSSKAYQSAVTRIEEHFRKQTLDIANIDDNEKPRYEYEIEAMAYHLIKDWSGIEVEQDGEVSELKYSGQNAVALLQQSDKGLEILKFIMQEATRIQIELVKFEDETVGKSENSTNGEPQKLEKPSKAKRK